MVLTPDIDEPIVEQRIAKEQELMRKLEGTLGKSILSENSKTRYAFNLPVSVSCRPTPVCRTVCYAAQPGGFMMKSWVIERAIKNYWFLMENSSEAVAQKISDECRDLSFLRFLAHGDLIPQLVDVINLVAKRNPNLKLWVTTRKPVMAKRLDRAENIIVWFSLDESEDSRSRYEKVRDDGFHFSWLRTTSDPVPQYVELIYPKQKGDLPADPRDCPADAQQGGIEMEDACGFCGYCYDPGPVPSMEKLQRRRRAFLTSWGIMRDLRTTARSTSEESE